MLGAGYIDALTGTNKVVWHLDSRDRLSFPAGPGQASGIAGGRAGIWGQETSPEPQGPQKQAIVRNGIYLYVPDQREFTLELLGQFRLEDLPPAED